MSAPSADLGAERAVRVKARDLCWTVYVVDPIAVPLVERLRRFDWITADRLTLASTILALVAAGLFAAQRFVLGALVYQLSFLLDCLDGKIAALRSKRHEWGGWFDQAGDGIRILACSAGMGYGLVARGYDAEWQVALMILYPSIRSATVGMVGGRPRPKPDPASPLTSRTSSHIELRPTPGAVLQAAGRRRLKPGSTVDTEAVAFTLGPLSGFPFVGFVAATVVDALHALYMLIGALRAARRQAGQSGGA